VNALSSSQQYSRVKLKSRADKIDIFKTLEFVRFLVASKGMNFEKENPKLGTERGYIDHRGMVN
jgi:hypothetical protein